MKYAIVIVTAFAASTLALSVQAQESAPLTRAEVQADLARAQQAGTLDGNDVTYPRQIPSSTQTQTAATADVTQSVGGAMPLSQSGSGSGRVTPAPATFNAIYRGGS